MTDRTIVEFCLSRHQNSPFTLVVHDTHERVLDLVAEALYAAKSSWDEPEYAVATMICSLGAVVSDLALYLGSQRGQHDVLVVDFTAKLVSDRVAYKTHRFGKFLEKHDVP
jgi:membrane protein DedA with SNARE-associated domain